MYTCMYTYVFMLDSRGMILSHKCPGFSKPACPDSIYVCTYIYIYMYTREFKNDAWKRMLISRILTYSAG